jgi:thioredoxin reductase
VLVVAPRSTARADALAGLGLTTSEQVVAGSVVGETIAADPTGATAVPGVWVAGNASDVSAQVVVSAAAGMRAGAMVNADLVAEETRLAVARRQGVAA